MSVPRSLVEMSFAGPINEAEQDELFDARTSFKTKENGRQNKRGGYYKRYGFSVLSTERFDTTTALSGYKLISDKDATYRFVDGQIESYDSETDRWKQLGRVPDASCRLIDMPSLGTRAFLSDIDYTNGYFAACWLSDFTAATATVACIVNAATGAIVRLPETVGTTGVLSAPLLGVEGNYFILIRYDSANTILAWYLDTTSATTINTGWVAFGASIATDANTSARYSVQSLSGGSARVAIGYINDSGGASRVTVKTLSVAGGVLETATVNTSSVTPDAISVCGSVSDTLWIAWNETTSVKVRGLTPLALGTPLATTATILTMATGTTYIGIAISSTAGKARVWANDTDATRRSQFRGIRTSAGAATTDGSQVTIMACQMGDKPFQYGGRYYAHVAGGDALQATLILVDWTEDVTFVRPVACAAPALTFYSIFGQGKTMAGPTATKLYAPMSITRSSAANATALVEYDFGSSTRWQVAQVGRSAYLSGGILSYTDGKRVAEAGFLVRPPKPTTSKAGTGLTGTFRYVAVYEEVDADGNWHVSGLSTPSDAVSPANETVTVVTAPLTVSARVSTLISSNRGDRVAFYRTADGGVAPYYRLTSVANNTATTTISYADTTADATLTANAKLYSQPGVLGTAQDRRPPPGLGVIASYNGMLVGAAGADLWFSGQPVSGEGTWFSPIFQVPFDAEITGLAPQDGTLYVFTRRAVYAISGDPPSDNGYGGLGVPQRLAVDVGCIDPRSVCVTGVGVFFQSERGIEVLTRARTVEWIGEGIQVTLAAYPVVTSATIDAASSLLYIELAAGESAGLVSGSGRTLVYDLALRQWDSIDRRTSAIGLEEEPGVADTPAQSACMIYTGTAYRYAWMQNDGRVYVENRSTHLDTTYWVTMRAETGQIRIPRGPEGIHVQSMQHMNKVLLLARRSTDHNLSMYAAYDNSTSYKTADTWNRAAIATLIASWPTQQLEYPLHVDSEGQAVQLKIEDVTPTGGTVGTGQGATWMALTFEGSPRVGAALLPAIAR